MSSELESDLNTLDLPAFESEDEENVEEDDDDDDDESPVISLKKAIKISELNNPDGGTEFEIIPQKPKEEKKTYFSQENMQYQSFLGQTSYGEEDEEGDEDLSPFERRAKHMEDISPDRDGTILKKITRQGYGDVCSGDNAIVRVHYSGTLEYCDEPFDSSRLRNLHQSFRMGAGEVIPGWEIGVRTMKKDEMAHFLISPKYAYGPRGCPPRIPPDATILFDIHLLSFVEHSGVEEFFSLTRQEKKDYNFSDLMRIMRAEQKVCKDLCSTKQFRKAISRYRRAVHALEDVRIANDEEEQQQKQKLCTFYVNLAVCNSKLNEHQYSVRYAKYALQIDETLKKAHFLMGKALNNMGLFPKARRFLLRAQKLSPNNPDVSRELKRLDENMAKFNNIEKDMYRKMFKPTITKKPEEGAIAEGKENEDQGKDNIPKESPLDRNYDDDQNLGLLEGVSEDFKKIVVSRLTDFNEDDTVDEMPFPINKFSRNELAFIYDKAVEMGLCVKQKVQNASQREIRITKKTNK